MASLRLCSMTRINKNFYHYRFHIGYNNFYRQCIYYESRYNFSILSAEHDPDARLKRKRIKKLRGKKRKKAHKKRLEQSLNVLFHPSLKKTPIINTKYD